MINSEPNQMNSWFERWRQRQSDLTQGVDADLVRDNRNRYRLAFGLIGFGLLLSLLDAKSQIPGTLRLIVVGIAVASLIAGVFLGAWARQEAAFLNKPTLKNLQTCSSDDEIVSR